MAKHPYIPQKQKSPFRIVFSDDCRVCGEPAESHTREASQIEVELFRRGVRHWYQKKVKRRYIAYGPFSRQLIEELR